MAATPPSGLPPTAAATAPTPIVAGPSVVPPPLPKPPVKNNPFVYLGIPQWLFDYRPSVPSRNMSIFLTVTIGLGSAYAYDRRECARLKQQYIDEVKWKSEEPLGTREMARRVKVYGARVPEDGDLERSSKWFKRYMRPILVASGTDYTLTTGTNPGGLGRTLLSEIRARRIAEASKNPNVTTVQFDPTAAVLEERDALYEQAELQAGIVLLGRGALKEYLWALRKGYGETIDLREEARLEGMGLGAGEKRKDGRWEREEEVMVRELERIDADAAPGTAPFDVPEAIPTDEIRLDSLESTPAADDPLAPTSLSAAYAPYRIIASAPAPPPPATTAEDTTPLVLAPSATLPEQAPLLLVPFSHPFGIRQWPAKMIHFFNQRSDVKTGGEYALAIINAQTRPFHSAVLRTPTGELQGMLDENLVQEIRAGLHKDLVMGTSEPTGSPDLDFLSETDELPSHFRKTYRTLPHSHEFARRNYYEKDLPPRLAIARELSEGRTPTKAEMDYPPKIESELRKERLEKELKWRRELEGWAMQRAGSGVAWEEHWGTGQGSDNPFKVFELVSPAQAREMAASRKNWEDERSRQDAAIADRERDTQVLDDE